MDSRRAEVIIEARAQRLQARRLCEASRDLRLRAAALQADLRRQRSTLLVHLNCPPALAGRFPGGSGDAGKGTAGDPFFTAEPVDQLQVEYRAWRRGAGLEAPLRVEARFRVWQWLLEQECGVMLR